MLSTQICLLQWTYTAQNKFKSFWQMVENAVTDVHFSCMCIMYIRHRIYMSCSFQLFAAYCIFFCHLHSQILWISDRKCSTDTILLFKFWWFWISYRNIRFGVSFPLSNYISKVWAWTWFNIFWLADNMLHFVKLSYLSMIGNLVQVSWQLNILVHLMCYS